MTDINRLPKFPTVADRSRSTEWTCTCDWCKAEAIAGRASGWPAEMPVGTQASSPTAERQPIRSAADFRRMALAVALLAILIGVTLALILAAGAPGGGGPEAFPR